MFGGKLVLGVVLLGGFARVATAFELMAERSSVGYWSPGDLEIRLMLTHELPDGSDWTWNAVAQEVLAEWNQHMTVLRLRGVEAALPAPAHGNGVNETFFSPTVYGKVFGEHVAGVTLLRSSGDPSRNVEADVLFNRNFAWDRYDGASRTRDSRPLLDFRRVALHEFGHVIGLDHPDTVNPEAPAAIMFSAASDLDTLTGDDAAGAAFLHGPGAAPAFVRQPEINAIPAIGTSTRLEFALSGTPPFAFEVYRNGRYVETQHLPIGLGRDYGAVDIRFEDPSDFGSYHVEAVNRVGRAVSRTYALVGEVASQVPIILDDLQDLRLSRGEPGALAVWATGHPVPSFAWYHDGQIVPGASTATLTLQGHPREAGQYEVEVSNSHGTTRSRRVAVSILDQFHSEPGWRAVVPATPPLMAMDLTFGNGMFVAVGYDGGVLTSPDGLNWTRRTLGTSASLERVIFADGRFVAAGSSDRLRQKNSIFVSYDGIGWIPAGWLVEGLWTITDLAFGNGIYVATDLYGKTLTSRDGLNWEAGSWQGPSDDYIDAVAFGNGRFVMSGRRGQVWTSTDGKSWVGHDSGVTVGMNTLTYGNGMFVGAGRVTNSPGVVATVGTSPDGVVWTQRAVNGVGSGLRIRYLGDRFHLTSVSQGHLVSEDGQEWVLRDFVPASQSNAGLIAKGAGRYVALPFVGPAYLSANGLHWLPTADAFGDGFIAAVAYGGGRFVVLDRGLRSTDGVAWDQQRLPLWGNEAAAFGNGTWVAVGEHGTMRSETAIDWAGSATTGVAYAYITYGGNGFVAVGSDEVEAGVISRSRDGSQWSRMPTTPVGKLRGVTYGDFGYVAVGNSGALLHSIDGSHWVPRTSGTTRDLHAVAWTGQRYVAVGGDGYGTITVVAPGSPLERNATVCVSNDGVNWSSDLLPFSEVLCAVVQAGDTLVAGGVQGLTLYSADEGNTWKEGPRAPTEVRRLATDGQLIFATSDGFFPLLRLRREDLRYVHDVAAPPQLTSWQEKTIVSLTTSGSMPLTVTWSRDGAVVAETRGTTWRADSEMVSPAVYFAEMGFGEAVSPPRPLVIAPTTNALFDGAVSRVAENVVHPNGNRYDQYLLEGKRARIRAQPGRVARISFRDMNEDLVQVEFSGAGCLTVVLDGATGPGFPPKYQQEVRYMKGHARVYLSEADETTHLAVFSIGTENAINQTLFKAGVEYDGIADLGSVAIHTRNGRLGSVRLGNAHLWSQSGVTGLWIPQTWIAGPVIVGDISAFESATPGLVLRASSQVIIAGGELRQDNGRPLLVDGLPEIRFAAGMTSHGQQVPSATNRAKFERDGEDVTSRITITP